MREIKFRVWDSEEMLSISVAMYNDIAGVQHDDMEAFGIEPYYKDVVLMQYICLKDKNGVEIYEGDIVLYHTMSNVYTCEIRYSEECSFLAYPIQFPNCAGYRIAKDIVGMRECSDSMLKIEVIGNIYENPELLQR